MAREYEDDPADSAPADTRAARTAPAPGGFGVVAGPGRLGRVEFTSQAEQIAFLRQMANKYTANPLIHDKAVDVVYRWGKCAAKAKLCQAVAIGRWMQENIKYINEGVETFQTPVRTITYRFGDCDDFASLTAALLGAIGIENELCGLEWAGMYRHIFCRALVAVPGEGTRQIPLDSTLDQDVRTLPNPVAISLARGDNPRVLAL